MVAVVVVVAVMVAPAAFVAAARVILAVPGALVVLMIALGMVAAVVVPSVVAVVIMQAAAAHPIDEARYGRVTRRDLLVTEVREGQHLAIGDRHGGLIVEHPVRIAGLAVVGQRRHDHLVGPRGEAGETIETVGGAELRGQHGGARAVLQLHGEPLQPALPRRRAETAAGVGMVAQRVVMAIANANVAVVAAGGVVARVHLANASGVVAAGVVVAVAVAPAACVAASRVILTVLIAFVVLVIALGMIAPVVIPVVVVLVLANAKVAEATDIAANRGGAGRGTDNDGTSSGAAKGDALQQD